MAISPFEWQFFFRSPEEWGFWSLWTTGLWRGRRAVLRATSEMIGRTKEDGRNSEKQWKNTGIMEIL